MTNSILIATIIFALIATFRKVRPTVWEHIPHKARWLVPILLAVAEEVAVALNNGQDWPEAALRGLLIGVGASGVHATVQNAPGGYNG